MSRMDTLRTIVLCGAVCALSACSGHVKGNVGLMPTYSVPNVESEWIRNGEPLIFEGESWYPQDGYDILLDSEVFLLGEYQGAQLFVDKVDVRPYDRLYTKFARNKFRIFKKKRQDD